MTAFPRFTEEGFFEPNQGDSQWNHGFAFIITELY